MTFSWSARRASAGPVSLGAFNSIQTAARWAVVGARSCHGAARSTGPRRLAQLNAASAVPDSRTVQLLGENRSPATAATTDRRTRADSRPHCGQAAVVATGQVCNAAAMQDRMPRTADRKPRQARSTFKPGPGYAVSLMSPRTRRIFSIARRAAESGMSMSRTPWIAASAPLSNSGTGDR